MNSDVYYLDDPWGQQQRRQDSRWVNPDGSCRDKFSHPYSYDEFWIWKQGPTENESAVYSDRLMQWDWDKFQASAEPFKKRFDQFTSDELSRFLSTYFDKTITAIAMAEGCNQATGYPYWIFWFREES